MNIKLNDKKYIWHPYTSNAETTIPIVISKGKGSYIYDDRGLKYIDAISSWWTNTHGHSHPTIAKAISKQASQLEHVIFAGFTHKPAAQLATELVNMLPGNMQKIFYSDNGSTAVEVAIKMAFQWWHNKGEKRTKIIAFNESYHGDTFGAMSASERSIFTKPFNTQLFDVIHTPIPKTIVDVKAFEKLILKHKNTLAGFIFEPLILGAGGMLMYEAALLDKLISICKKHKIFCIADEVMTGFGRTGKLFACNHLKQTPDIICLSKGLTGGALPLGVTACTKKTYDGFNSSDKTKTFFHGHSFTANPIACSAALASIGLFKQKQTHNNIKRIVDQHKKFATIVVRLPRVKEVRQTGTVIAIELNAGSNTHYLNTIRDRIYNYFIGQRIVLRPLGNIIYILPPYCISNNDLNHIYYHIITFINKLNDDI